MSASHKKMSGSPRGLSLSGSKKSKASSGSPRSKSNKTRGEDSPANFEV